MFAQGFLVIQRDPLDAVRSASLHLPLCPERYCAQPTYMSSEKSSWILIGSVKLLAGMAICTLLFL